MTKYRTLRSNLPLLQKYVESGKVERTKMCRHYKNEMCKCLRLISHNVLQRNLPLTRSQLNELRPFQDDLRAFSSKRVPNKQKLRVLNQKGGALLPILIPAVITLVSELIARSR